jgi:spore coat protein CotF
MPFGAHETMEVHEILNEKINLINHFSMYAEQAQSGQVRNLVERHLQIAIQHYDQLVAYTHNYSAAGSAGAAGAGYGMNAGNQNNFRTEQVSYQDIQYGLRQPAQVTPQMKGRFSDQQILCSVLSFHKNSAKAHMAGALECADPNVRQMLIHGAVSCNDQAYETFMIMNQQGQYQVPTMNDHTAKTFLHTYQPMNTNPSMNSFQ